MVNLIINNDVIKDVELIIFDKDGTLIDVHTYWCNMIKFRAMAISSRLKLNDKYMFGIMDAMGVDINEMKIKPDGPVGIKKRSDVLKSGVEYLISKGLSYETKLFNEIFDIVDKNSLAFLNDIIKPINGFYDLIDAIKNNGCKIAIATTDKTNRAELAMDVLGVLDKIDIIIGADKIVNPKPHHEIIEKICHELDVKINKSIMVGDSNSDVLTGVNAGCLASIGVMSGLTPGDILSKLTPYVIKDISDIKIMVN